MQGTRAQVIGGGRAGGVGGRWGRGVLVGPFRRANRAGSREPYGAIGRGVALTHFFALAAGPRSR